MTVAELIAQLEAVPQDAVVVIDDQRGGFDEVTGIEVTADTAYWPGLAGAPRKRGQVVEFL